jgi:beta-mannosidase
LLGLAARQRFVSVCGVQLSGPWRAAVADDDLRREGIGLDFDDDGWAPIDVPGHWRSTAAFVDADGPLLYRTRFDLDSPHDGSRAWVTLDGVFYQADVWLDGAYLGDPEGYFFPHSFDITDLARLGAHHVLAVEVACPPQTNRRAKRNITGIFQHWDGMDTDWNPGGLWRPVHLETTGPVRIDRLRVLCRDASESRAHLRLHARLLSSTATQVVRLRTTVDGDVLGDREHTLALGANEVDWNLDIDSPRLWWPWSLGEQPLSDVFVEVLIDDRPSHTRNVRTGLRQVVVDDWRFSVNGERLFAKGASLAPTRQALATATAEELADDVRVARDAGLDLLRIYGHITRPELYDAADEDGMLIWQDFPLQWGYSRTVRRAAVAQAVEAVDALGHHPSIAVWCAHNEPLAVRGRGRHPEGDSTSQYLLAHQLPGWNRAVLDGWVKRSFERADETRTTIAHSGVLPHVPQLSGTDSHLYYGWHHGSDRDLGALAATMPRMVRFVGEFGAQAVPNSAPFVDAGNWPVLDWERLESAHGLYRAGFERTNPPLRFPTFDAWRRATQRYQADLLRHQIETLRRLKYRPTGGFCMFFLQDAAPMVSCSVLDHDRVPKAGYDALVEACRPVIVVADRPPDHVRPGSALALDVHVVSDERRALEGVVCTAAIRWPGGSHSWRFRGDVPADSCVRVGVIQFVVADAPGALWVDLTLEHPEFAVSNRYVSFIAGED